MYFLRQCFQRTLGEVTSCLCPVFISDVSLYDTVGVLASVLNYFIVLLLTRARELRYPNCYPKHHLSSSQVYMQLECLLCLNTFFVMFCLILFLRSRGLRMTWSTQTSTVTFISTFVCNFSAFSSFIHSSFATSNQLPPVLRPPSLGGPMHGRLVP